MTNIDNERANFEAWAKVNAPYLNLRRPQHDERGFYWQETETQFSAFQAVLRAKSDKAVSVEALEGLCDEWDNLQVPGSADSYELGQFHAYRGAMRELRALIAKETGNG